MSTQQLVTVKSVTVDMNLRAIHDLRKYWMPRLKRGQAALFVNVARDKARLLDAMGGVHNYYADNGEVFDVRTIQQKVGALRLRLSPLNAATSEAIESPGKRPRKRRSA